MTRDKIIFIDTAPFIYYIENHPKFAGKVEKYLSENLFLDSNFVTSVITYMEYCVIPERERREDLILKFDELLLRLPVEIKEISLPLARSASKLRAKYKFLKGLDALQLALAIQDNCDEFLTNDSALLPIKEIKIVLLEKIK